MTCPTPTTLYRNGIQDVKAYRWIPTAARGGASGVLAPSDHEPDQGRVASCKATFASRGTADDVLTTLASPLDEAIGREATERYEAALAELRDEEREAIVARIELECSYDEMAVMLGKPSPNAARVAVRRAVVRLALKMKDSR